LQIPSAANPHFTVASTGVHSRRESGARHDGAAVVERAEEGDDQAHALQRRELAKSIISRDLEGRAWPGCSPDLNPCDNFLWGYIKSRIYTNRDSHGVERPFNPTSLPNLRERIEDAISTITIQMCEESCRRVFNLCTELIITEGRHTGGLIVHE